MAMNINSHTIAKAVHRDGYFLVSMGGRQRPAVKLKPKPERGG
jgi:hypothetical protein